ncbi:hypothetical protein M9H77_02570 [Catharanthus roseus]|uniref:Uncharacterized protein n=1 Tax=Catharanthus roseus TaxID=4058 RepID=A0ACC0C9A3_CATRO|nr:hypothetical protein M9H77_02570 [Catharanthus roseus]
MYISCFPLDFFPRNPFKRPLTNTIFCLNSISFTTTIRTMLKGSSTKREVTNGISSSWSEIGTTIVGSTISIFSLIMSIVATAFMISHIPFSVALPSTHE